MQSSTIFRSWLRMALLLSVVALTMAVSCPHPVPPEPGPVIPVDTKSKERVQFESVTSEGLYLKGESLITYDMTGFQRAANPIRRTYRIQSDDQSKYLHILYTEALPAVQEDEVECEIHYGLSAGESTTLIVKLVVVKQTDEYLWLWNEFQKVGLMVQRL
ncbi:MAG: hypothetical protein IJK90_08465 [Bacteroidales bacterium]|nr:hypothetical protein [Bacteroidales bacterium]